MARSKIQSFDLFKAAMGNAEYLTEISTSSANQAQFLTTLEEGHLTAQDIAESIQIVQNPKVKSILIAYLLSQEEYLTHLEGQSFLERLAINENHTPSRLNALVHQLDLKILTPEIINKLQPEAAANILCSIPHFHQLTRTQIAALIGRYPKHELIVYWMSHFASMPNAHYTLVHLMEKEIAGTSVTEALTEIEPNQKEAIIRNIIEHLGVFRSIPRRILDQANKESHLVLAINLYLNGHYDKAYVSYINQLTKKLLGKNHSFSLATIELLFSLNDKLAFKELASQTAFLTNRYIRSNAREGNIALFYQNNQLNIQRIIQDINLNPPASEMTKEPARKSSDSSENPFIESLVKKHKKINCFEYFLIHYKGSSQAINQLLSDYLKFYEQSEYLTSRSKTIHNIGFMLTNPEIEPTLKEAIFTAFLNHPVHFDEQISSQLFLYDAKKIIRYFSLCGGEKNYQCIIKLCTLALKNLSFEKNQEIIQIAQKALSETQLELNFSKRQGFFSGLFKRIKRCWIYGWTGFFKPNSPEYVAPESLTHNKDLKKSSRKPFTPIQRSEKDLPTLLNEIPPPFTQKNFEEIIKALELYSLQAIPQDELNIRQKVHTLYHQLMDKKENNALYRWLKENQNPFILNQFKLLELVLKERPRDEINLLLKEINKDSDYLHYISDEFDCEMPELVVQDSPKSLPSSEASDFVADTTKVLAGYASSATGYAQNALSWAGGWAEGFFTQVKNSLPQKEKEVEFVVEHIDSFFKQK